MIHVFIVNAAFISIHALREEGDPEKISQIVDCMMISIHALREEGDPGASECA